MLLSIAIFTLSACEDGTPPVVTDDKYELTDLSGKTQAEIETIFAEIDINVTFRVKETNDTPEGQFIRYIGYQVGEKVNFGISIIIEIAAKVAEAPVISGASEATVYVSVVGNPPTFDIYEGVTATDYLGNDIPFGSFFYVLSIKDRNDNILSEVNFYAIGTYKVTYRAQTSGKPGLNAEVERLIHVVVPPFDTNYTDELRLTESYQGKSFINDGIGEVILTSHTDADTTNFRDPITNTRFTVRYLGIDAPEATSKYDPWGIKAANFVREALDGAEKIILQAEGSRQDGNGRYLAWVWYVKDGVTRLLNLELVETAYAWTSGASATQYGNIFTVAQAETQLTGRRIYGEVDPDYDYSTAGTPVEISELLDNFDLYVGKKVTISGVITTKVGNSVFIEDEGRGIYLYTGYSLTNELRIGYEVTIQGLVPAYFNESKQLSNYKIDNMILLSVDNEVIVTTIMASQMANYVGRVVTFDHLVVESVQLSNTAAYTIFAKDTNNGTVTIRVDATTATFVPSHTLKVGDHFKLTAVPITQFHTNYQIMLPGMGSISLLGA